MKKLFLSLALIAALAMPAMAQVRFHVNVNIGPPPVYVAPPVYPTYYPPTYVYPYHGYHHVVWHRGGWHGGHRH